MRKKFPTFAFLVLIIGIIWLFSELGVISANIPWLPIIVIILSLGWIINHNT